jgi:hypothetical protein
VLRRLFIEPPGPTAWLLALFLVLALAIGAGFSAGWLAGNGGGSVSAARVNTKEKDSRSEARKEEVPLNLQAPPLTLFAAPVSPEEWNIFYSEVELAAARGFHRYVAPLRLSWQEPWDSTQLIEQLSGIIQRDPEAMLVLDVDLNPTTTWLVTHGEAAVNMENQTSRFASPASQPWKTYAVQEAFHRIQAVLDSPVGRHLQGLWLSAMHEGSWRFEAGYDRSLASEAAFERWVVTRYGSPEEAAKAWKLDSLPRPLTPDYPDVADSRKVFFDLPVERRQVDYLRFVSETTADTLARIAAEFRERFGDDLQLLARYGFGLELGHNAAGHFALGNLLNSELDGFISPVSYASRGSGGTGAPMAAIHSARMHGKVWHLLDDTRTGVSRDALTGAITRIEGLRAQDVYTVQERNFACALTQGMGLIWADPHAQGWLYDAQQWEKFRQLADIYCTTWPEFRMERPSPEQIKAAEGKSRNERRNSRYGPRPEEPAPAAGEASDQAVEAVFDNGMTGEAEGEFLSPRLTMTTLQVVVDEESRFYQQYDSPLNDALILQGRDAAIMCGAPVEFVLLDDVIEERTPDAGVYLFLNAFHMTIEERERLQERFRNEQASVIWLYAPGYFRDEARTDHITSTTRITVEPFTKPERAGSRMAINGRWIRQNETFGYRGVLSPLFYINDNAADVIAVYEGSNKPSAALKTMEDGWTSVLITDAGITPQLLRELLYILEQHTYFQTTSGRYVDTTWFGQGLMAIHARQVGERAIDLGDYYNVTDLLDPNLGWPERDSFLIQLDHGETRLLQLSPL